MRLAVDLGAAKTACMVATPDGIVRGLGVEPAWSSEDPGAAIRSLQLAVASAEMDSGAPALRAALALNGADVESIVIFGEARCQRTADAAAARRALQAAWASLPRDRVLLHVLPQGYSLDGAPPVADPRGRQGRTLRAEALAIVAPVSAALEARERLAEAGLALDQIVAGPYAAGLAALTAEERRDGAVVIDLGAAFTGIAAFKGEQLVHLQTLAAGQASVTLALSRRLACPEAAAERVKLRHLSLGPDAMSAERIEAGRLGPDGRMEVQEIARMALAEAASGAVDAIFAAAAEALAKAPLPQGAERWKAVLVGGGAQLPGLAPLAEAALARPVRIGAPRGVSLAAGLSGGAAPELAAVAGVLARGEIGFGEAVLPPLRLKAPEPPRRAGLSAALRWLHDNF